MRINVSQQLKASIGSIRNYEVSEIVNVAGGKSMVQGEVKLMRTNRAFWLRAHYTLRLKLPAAAVWVCLVVL